MNETSTSKDVDHEIYWRCILPRHQVPDLFHSIFRLGKLPGRDERSIAGWRQYDDEGRLVYEVKGSNGMVPSDAHPLARALMDCAFEYFPEAFGLHGTADLPHKPKRKGSPYCPQKM